MLSIVVPCYNEEKNISLLVDEFRDALKNVDAELILVNNGSTDNSQEIIRKITKKYKTIRCIIVKKNIGYGHGILAGLKAARGDVLAYTHADLQCDPMDVVKAYDVFRKIKEDKILVKGNRKGRSSMLTSCFHVLAAILFLKKFDDINGQPKLFHKEMLKMFINPPLGFQLDFYIQYKALKNGYNVMGMPVKFGVRKYGYSKWASSIKSRIKNVSRFLGYMLKLRFFGE